MQRERATEEPTGSFSSVIRDLAGSAKDLFHSEVGLVRAEMSDSARRIARHSAQAAIFGAFLALSVIPFMAFLVIGFGELLDGRYWLSSLLVAILFAAVGGTMTYKAYEKLKEDDLTLPKTRQSLEEIKSTVTGEQDELSRLSRRAIAFGKPSRTSG